MGALHLEYHFYLENRNRLRAEALIDLDVALGANRYGLKQKDQKKANAAFRKHLTSLLPKT